MNFIRNLALNASAGTGKTFRLSIRFISLMILGARIENIYALTFTNKATDEMKDRIKDIFVNPQDKKNEINMISIETGKSIEYIEEFLKTNKEIVLKELNITTIDSFASSIVKTYASYIGVNRDFNPSEISEDKEKDQFLKFLKTKEKTKELVVYANESGRSVDEIMDDLRTIHEKEKEVELFFADIIMNGNDDIKTTMIDVEMEIMREAAVLSEEIKNRGGSKTAVNSFVAKNIKELLKKSVLSKESLNYTTYKKIYSEDLDFKFLNLKESIKQYFELKEKVFFRNVIKLFIEFKDSLKEISKKEGIISFNEVSNLAYNAIENNDLDFLLFQIDSKIKHLLIDEFQDTSWVQYKMLSPIIENIVNEENEFRSFFIVGDKKQSIYRFRGGNQNLFDYIVKKYNMEEKFLDKNFRSSKAVVEFQNNIFKEEYDGFTIQEAKKDDDGEINIKLVEQKDIEQTVVEAVFKKLEDVNENDIAILTFTNDEAVKMQEIIKEKRPELKVVTDNHLKITEANSVKVLLSILKYTITKEEFYINEAYAIMGVLDFEIDHDFFEAIRKLGNKPDIVVKLIINKFRLFNNDCNLLKIVEIASSVISIEFLLKTLEDNDINIINSEDVDGIKIITMHKSKGLEFKNVFIVDKLYKKQNVPSLLLEYNKDLEVNKVWKSFSGRELFDYHYKRVLNDERVKQDLDDKNLMYVAMTRAEDSLTLITLREKSRIRRLSMLQNIEN